jgi:membrane protease YdiL (CAAX protease family)
VRPGRRIAGAAVFVVAAVYDALLALVVPTALEVPADLAVAAVCTGLARAAGASWNDLGMRTDRLRSGAGWGIAAAAAAVTLTATVALVPFSRHYLADATAVGMGTGRVLYETLVRIPLGTAVVEEVIFRGAIYGLLSRVWKVPAAALIASLLFGLWHVLPTLSTLSTVRDAGALGGGAAGALSVVTTVAVTTGAGLIFVWLRERSGSLLAPILAHAGLNASAFALGAMLATSGL